MSDDSMTVPVLVISSSSTANYLIERTIRNLVRLGYDRSDIFDLTDLDHLQFDSGLLLIQAGCWMRSNLPLRFPPASATGRPVIALGAVGSPEPMASRRKDLSDSVESDAVCTSWSSLLAATGGDLQSIDAREQLASLTQCCWLDRVAASDFFKSLENSDLATAIGFVLQKSAYRVVHWQPLDVFYDQRLRVVQVITSIQRGGAERIAIDLHRSWLRNARVTPLLLAVNSPSRSPFPTPESTIQLSHVQPRSERWTKCQRIINSFAADVVHTHLLSRSEHQLLRDTRCPTLATIHNARSGWQAGTEQLDPGDLDLIVACSQAVEQDLLAAGVRIPTRTVWNGINLTDFQVDLQSRVAAREGLLKRFDLPANAILIAALANPRPQKRLERLPAILQATQQLLSSVNDVRPIHLLLAGEPSQGNQLADQSMQLIREQVTKWHFESRIHWLGCVDDSRGLLAGIDLLVSPSDFEGLSLAHLEALSCGTRVVASDVGGTSEIALRADGIDVVPVQSDDLQYATTLIHAIEKLKQPLQSTPIALQRDFSLIRMRDGYLRLYERLANQVTELESETNTPSVEPCRTEAATCSAARSIGRTRKTSGLLLITNNFSTGGAQSSARRLLASVQAKGYPVRAAVLQEDLENPTPGRRELVNQRIEVQCLPKAGNIDPLIALRPLFEAIDKSQPKCILLWNVIPEYKMLIADSLWNTRIVDVSPGEMNLQSLERYFQNPRPGLPYRTFSDYGRRLAGAVVKYADEASQVQQALKVPVSVIPNGVPIPQQTAPLLPKAKLVIGTAARISPQKRFEDLIEAFRLAHEKMPEYELQIAGGVERGAEAYYEELCRQAADLPVRWVGELLDTQPFLLQLDLFVMISEPAGCPNASLEAMAVGLPIIATDFGGAGEQVVDRLNGLLVPNRNPAAFARAVISLASELDLRRQYGRASRRRAEELFSVERMTNGYLQLMQLGR